MSVNRAATVREICAEVFGDPASAKKAMMKANGIIGAANGSFLNGRGGDLFTILKQRFFGGSELLGVVGHKSFDEFLALRVQELQGRPK